MDPFHLFRLANKAMARNTTAFQVDGQRLRSVRFTMLKARENLDEEGIRI